MTILRYQADESAQQVPEAAQWEAGLAAREDGSAIGLGFFLFDADGKPIAGCLMTPEQALEQGRYLIENAERMQSAFKEMAEVAVRNATFTPLE